MRGFWLFMVLFRFLYLFAAQFLLVIVLGVGVAEFLRGFFLLGGFGVGVEAEVFFDFGVGLGCGVDVFVVFLGVEVGWKFFFDEVVLWKSWSRLLTGEIIDKINMKL